MLYFVRNANIRFVEENSSKKEGREEITRRTPIEQTKRVDARNAERR